MMIDPLVASCTAEAMNLKYVREFIWLAFQLALSASFPPQAVN